MQKKVTGFFVQKTVFNPLINYNVHMDNKTDIFKKYFASCFWDIETSQLNMKKDYFFIIARVLEHGIFKQILLLRDLYTDDQIIEVVMNSNNLSPRVANYWALFFKLPKENIKSCTRTIQFRLRP